MLYGIKTQKYICENCGFVMEEHLTPSRPDEQKGTVLFCYSCGEESISLVVDDIVVDDISDGWIKCASVTTGGKQYFYFRRDKQDRRTWIVWDTQENCWLLTRDDGALNEEHTILGRHKTVGAAKRV
jgi:hypothetical protein